MLNAKLNKKKNKEKGIAYYTQERLKKMDYAFSR